MRRGALKRELLIVATGDHNLRMSYAGGYAHHLHGVPILIWAPESLRLTREGRRHALGGASRHLPDDCSVVLGRTPEIHEGRNLFANESMDLIVSYTGIAAGSWVPPRSGTTEA